jgi:uncharacterized protein (UPF0335 family)
VQYELDILQVDYHLEKEKGEENLHQVKELRRKNRNLQIEINEADRITTKRMNRLIEKIEELEKDKHDLTKQLQDYETDLESVGMMCFVCRSGIKSTTCSNCTNMFCKDCFSNVDKCPFCRTSLDIPSDNILI